MGYQEDLERLEGVVEKLLHRLDGLVRERDELARTLQARETELEELRRRNAGLAEERAEVHQRVSRLLGAIEEWEQSHGAAAFGGEAASGDAVSGGAEEEPSGEPGVASGADPQPQLDFHLDDEA